MTAASQPDRRVRSVAPSAGSMSTGPMPTGSRSTPSKSTGRSGDSTRTIRVAWRAASVAQVRRTLVEDLESRAVPAEVVDEAEIVVSELLSNAIRHARPLADGNLRVHWKVKAGVVEVEVSDGGGASTPRPAPRTVWAASGRGLRIVRSLAHEWGVTEDRHGTTVWASVGGPSRRRSH